MRHITQLRKKGIRRIQKKGGLNNLCKRTEESERKKKGNKKGCPPFVGKERKSRNYVDTKKTCLGERKGGGIHAGGKP